MFLMLSATYLSPRWGLWVHGVLAFLHTFRPSGAFKCRCAERTLQMYFSNRLSVNPTGLVEQVFVPVR